MDLSIWRLFSVTATIPDDGPSVEWRRRTLLLVASCTYVVSLHVAYKSVISPAFEYLGYTYVPPNPLQLGLGFTLAILPSLWLPLSKDLIKVKITMPSGSTLKGLAEPGIKNVKVNEIIQFERNFFCRLDHKEKDVYNFWFTHK